MASSCREPPICEAKNKTRNNIGAHFAKTLLIELWFSSKGVLILVDKFPLKIVSVLPLLPDLCFFNFTKIFFSLRVVKKWKRGINWGCASADLDLKRDTMRRYGFLMKGKNQSFWFKLSINSLPKTSSCSWSIQLIAADKYWLSSLEKQSSWRGQEPAEQSGHSLNEIGGEKQTRTFFPDEANFWEDVDWKSSPSKLSFVHKRHLGPLQQSYFLSVRLGRRSLVVSLSYKATGFIVGTVQSLWVEVRLQCSYQWQF